jgi:hypothetical protein
MMVKLPSGDECPSPAAIDAPDDDRTGGQALSHDGVMVRAEPIVIIIITAEARPWRKSIALFSLPTPIISGLQEATEH